MTVFSINDPIFDRLKNDPTVNLLALQKIVDLCNTSSVLNQYVSHAAQIGDVKFRLAAAGELKKATAAFDYNINDALNMGTMVVIVDPTWLVGATPVLSNGGVPDYAVASVLSHEFDHYSRVDMFKALDLLADPSQAYSGTPTERFIAYATGRMKVEVLGWYASLNSFRSVTKGQVNAQLGDTDLRRVGVVEAALYSIEQRGIKLGLRDQALIDYVAENGAPILSKNPDYDYWRSYEEAMAAVAPGVSMGEIRAQISYSIPAGSDIINWVEYAGDNDLTMTEVTFRNGLMRLIARDSSDNAVSTTEVERIAGDLTKQTTYYADGRIIGEAKTQTGTIVWTSSGTIYEDGSTSETTRYTDGRTIRTNADENGAVTSRATIQTLADNSTVETITYADGHIVRLTIDSNGQLVSQEAVASGSQTLSDFLTSGRLIDSLSLVKAIQSGQPLPIAASGLRLAAGFNPANTELAFASSAVAGVLSLVSLEAALRRGDGVAALASGASALQFGVDAYAAFAAYNVLTATDFEAELVARAALDNATDLASSISEVLPFINIVNSLSHDDPVGAAMAALSFTPAAPVAIAYTVFNLITSLFGGGDDEPEWSPPPEPWGMANAVWSGNTVASRALGNEGQAAAATTFDNFLAYLQQLADEEQAANPGFALGVIANRLPGLDYRAYSGYRLLDVDPLTGAERNAQIHYGLDGSPYDAAPGSPEASQSLMERFVRSALARGAIAATWEVQTAQMQSALGAPDAGLTEEERAGRTGHLATAATGAEQIFRPIALDLDGDGVEVTDKAHGVAFDVDDSGFLKNTAWVKGDDGLLVLDRNLNGTVDSGRELFSNGLVDVAAKGLAALHWVDADYDGTIDADDPVFNQLKVWKDADGDGLADAGETQTLAQLGITELDYGMGTFRQGGQDKQLGSPDLVADTAGTRTHVVSEGIIVQSSNGEVSLLATQVDDQSALEANRDRVALLEDTETLIAAADLLANDTLAGLAGQQLRLAGVANFTHGTGFLDTNGFVHFKPEANYFGAASFEYLIEAATGQTATALVDLTIANVNDAPTVTVSYNGGANSGQLLVTDVDDPNGTFTFEILAKPQKGGASVDAAGNFTYTNWTNPNTAGTSGSGSESDPFRVKVSDAHGAATVASVDSVHNGSYSPTVARPPSPPPRRGGGKKPISVDLNGNGFSFTKVDDSNVFFDANGDGFKHRIAWPSADDGLLAYDADGNGLVEHAAEISFAAYLPGAQTDLEGLRAFDSNGDGLLSAADAKWAKFGIWQDANHDGITDTGEFRTLGEMGVASVALTSDGEFAVIDGQTVHGIGTVTMTDGSTRNLADVTLEYSDEVLVTHADGTSEVVNRAAFSPDGEQLDGTADDDLILGKSGNNVVMALGGNDVVFEDGGNDTIDGGAGNDALYSGADNDVVLGGDGDDLVFAGQGSDLVLGGTGQDALFGEDGNDILFGGDGNDMLAGGYGNDVLSGDRGDDQVYGESGNDALFGMAGADELFGMEGSDKLDGGAGIDTMAGGTGDDTYVVDDVADRVIEMADEGNDTVESSLALTLGANVENLVLTGSAAIDGVGNTLDNVLVGNVGVNTLTGGLGNDTYVVGSDDTVVENAGEGLDTIRASFSYTLGANLENLDLMGDASIDGYGNALDNAINGNNGANQLDGGAGADVLSGGLGDDTYIIDADDTVVEHTGAGNDTVLSAIDHVLAANVENIVLTGTANANATGNALDNRLMGNAGVNILAGGAGNDTYAGLEGGDVVAENANEGVDTVESAISWTLGANVENLVLTGTAAISATGNELDNVLTGNAGANMLVGGLGNDTYVVDAADTAVENANEGTDIVVAGFSYTLGANLENLTLVGAANINGTGNALENHLIGNDGVNTLAGGDGNDVLDGGAGADVMNGGGGADTYYVDNDGDVIQDVSDGSWDVVYSSVSYVLRDDNFLNELRLTGSSSLDGTGNSAYNHLYGNAGTNILTGFGGNDYLDGGVGADTLVGGVGDDIYVVDNIGDVVTERVGEGTDTIKSYIDYVLGSNQENLSLIGSGNRKGTGNELNNTLTGNAGANVIDGGAGADMMTGGKGNDTYVVDNVGDSILENVGEGTDSVQSSIAWALGTNVENLVLGGSLDVAGTGNELNNVLIGNTGNNLLTGYAGNDQINGGIGADTLIGGLGDDTYYVDNGGDSVIENAGEGVDTIRSSTSWTLGANVENLILTGTFAINGTGNELNNVITGNTGSNILTGGLGDDTYNVDNAGDSVIENANEGTDTVQSSIAWTLGANIENLVLTGTAAITANGNDLDNILTGNAGANILDGGTGADVMNGGGGADTYYVDNVDDVIHEVADGKWNVVYSSVSYTLSDHALNELHLTGIADINGTGNDNFNHFYGNAGDNILTGYGGDDYLNGGVGADTLVGGIGNDIYVVDNIGDVVTEITSEGTDVVWTAIDYTLGDNLENLTLLGSDNLRATGNDLDNILTGNAGANVLDGGSGADVMNGGGGADTYIVDNVGDAITDVADGSWDVVYSSVTYTLSDQSLNELRLTGSANINGTGNIGSTWLYGNVGDNVLTDFAGNDALDGGAGADSMSGGLGDDVYVVDNVGDNVTENANEGTDTVKSSISWTLGANFENLSLTGTAAINATGNALNNILTGNAGANILDGGSGADVMNGGAGGDTYYVDNVSDVIHDVLDGSWDVVYSSVTYTLTDGALNELHLTGDANLDSIGNTNTNYLFGNSGANVLTGLDGNDHLDGGAGADTLIGGTGNDTLVGGEGNDVLVGETGSDTYRFAANFGNDTIYENDTVTGNLDRIVFDANITQSDVTVRRENMDLLLSVASGSQLRVDGWFADDTRKIERVEFVDGTVWTAAELRQRTNFSPEVGIAIADQLATEDTQFQFVVPANAFADGDAAIGDTLSYSIVLADGSALPGWMTFDSVTRTLSGIPTNSDVDVLNIKVTATDAMGASSSHVFALTVTNVNDAPIVTNAIADQTATEEAAFSFTVPANTFAEVDTGDALALSATLADGSALPPWLAFDSASGIFSGTPTNGDVCNLRLKVTATDQAGASASSTFEVVVANTNDAPVIANVVSNQLATEGMDFSFIVPANTFLDTDLGDSLSYTATLADGSALPSWLSFDATNQTFSGTATQYDLGMLHVTVTATDGSGSNVSGDFILNVISHGDAVLVGTASADTLVGFSGDDTLDGSAGADTMIGRLGNDTYYVDDGGDSIVESTGEGIDTVQSIISWTLDANIENLALTGTDVIDGSGNDLDNVITGNASDNVLDGGAGADVMSGGAGYDTYYVDNVGDVIQEVDDGSWSDVYSSVSYTLNDYVLRDLWLTGIADLDGSGNDNDNGLYGNVGANVLTGYGGDDHLDGGAGADTMIGGLGNDVYYVSDGGDVVIENFGEGQDRVLTSVSWTLGANVEDLILTGIADIDATGNDIDNFIAGNIGDNVIDGASGADLMRGGSGNDTYYVDNVGDVIEEVGDGSWDIVYSSVSYTLSTFVNEIYLTGSENLNGTGNDGENWLNGNGGNNTLMSYGGDDWIDGGAGTDTMIGGLGNDTYYVDNIGDVVQEADDGSWDVVYSSVSYTLSTFVNEIYLTGSENLNGTGNDGENWLNGNGGNNTLMAYGADDWIDGGAGADAMIGGLGNDTYYVDNTGDIVIENAGEGTDTVKSSISWSLGANVENLTLTGSGTVNCTGNSLNNILKGNTGANILNGGAGIDTMSGGQGNDTYVVDNAGDVAVENANAGVDSIQSSISWTLGANVENLILTGTAAINGTGNALDNVLTGNSGANILDGGLGADVLNGGAGADTYYVDNIGDVIQDAADGCWDVVYSSISYSFEFSINELHMTGSADLSGTGGSGSDKLFGNAGANVLTGLAGSDSLDGGGGADTMIGGLGDDTYVVDNVGDIVTETAGEGIDIVKSSISWSLGTNVEKLTLTGTAAINGTGNGLDNTITGNAGANVLVGNAGNDTLVGGAGNDTYQFARGDGADLIQENNATAGNHDMATFLAGVGSDQIWFQHTNNDLVVSVIGTTDTLTIQNWYVGSQYHVEEFQTVEDNKRLLDSQVDNLVQAMAAFAPPASGQTTLPQSYRDVLAPVIAVNWQ